MKQVNIKTLSIILLLFSFLSCKKYLDVKSNNALTVPATLEDLQALLDDADIMNKTATPSLMETSADDYFLLKSTYDARQPVEKQAYTWKLGDYNFQNDWSKGYAAVYNANLSLETINEIPVTATNKAKWENVKGSALFFRSYYFLFLTWQYAKSYDAGTSNTDLGIVLKLSSDFNQQSKRASVKECYEKIITDAKEAALYLPPAPQHVMRPSKAAAYGLLARAYLSMRDYDNALKYSDSCLQLRNQLMNYNGDSDIPNINSNVPFAPFNKEIIFYSEMFSGFALHVPARAKIDTLLHASYNNGDLRKIAFFRPNSGYRQFKGSYSANSSLLFSGMATNEMYLIRAESYAALGDKTSALSDLNTLLEMRTDPTLFTPLDANTPQEALNIIRIERRKELLMRSLRWIDIKRYNKEGANLTLRRIIDGTTITLQPNSGYYAIPLPKDIILNSGIEQN
jgi:starch-binding outer membrane protein, SusD/RagB family